MIGGFQANAFTRAFQRGLDVVTGSLDVLFGGGFFPRRKRDERIEPVEAVQIIREQGNPDERNRALEAQALIARLAREKRLLSAEEKRAARAESRWAVAVAQRIEREREDEELALVALMLD